MNDLSHYLRQVAQKYPAAWKQYDNFYNDKAEMGGWPDWRFVPVAAAYAIVSATHPASLPLHVGDIGELHTLAAWRLTQGVYQFAPEVFEALRETDMPGPIPTEVLLRLPQWGVYLDFEERVDRFAGAFAALESDANNKSRELRLLLDAGEDLMPITLILAPDASIEDALELTLRSGLEKWARHFEEPPAPDGEIKELVTEYQKFAPVVRLCLSLLLYLCVDAPDVSGREEPDSKPGKPTPTKTRHGVRFFPPDQPRVWRVGEAAAVALRRDVVASRTDSSGRTVRPHIRRAHWHGYWSGTTDQRRFSIRWQPPLVIKGE